MRKTFIIQGMTFPSKKTLKEYTQKILYSYNNGDVLSFKDQAFMQELLLNHPSYEQKIGVGIRFIKVKKNPIYPTMGFWITRIDWSETDFSFLECITETSHKIKFERACRVAIAPSVLKFKQEFFKAKTFAVCPYTGEAMTYQTCHVHHMQPSFKKLLDSFVEENNIKIPEVQIGGKGEDNVVCDYLIDQVLKQKWIDYHDGNAQLQVVSPKANLSVLK